MVVVLPEPCRPTISQTEGGREAKSGLGVLAEQLQQLVADDLEHLLIGRELQQDFGAERLGADVREQLVGHVDVDVAFEQRFANAGERGVQVLFVELALAAQVLEDALEFFCEVFKHGLAVLSRFQEMPYRRSIDAGAGRPRGCPPANSFHLKEWPMKCAVRPRPPLFFVRRCHSRAVRLAFSRRRVILNGLAQNAGKLLIPWIIDRMRERFRKTLPKRDSRARPAGLGNAFTRDPSAPNS